MHLALTCAIRARRDLHVYCQIFRLGLDLILICDEFCLILHLIFTI
jgi:hypothetical protein